MAEKVESNNQVSVTSCRDFPHNLTGQIGGLVVLSGGSLNSWPPSGHLVVTRKDRNATNT
jgi:hypothetical protein